MPRKSKEAPIVCDYFTWQLRQKSSGVYFADGRTNNSHNLGRHSLGTRDQSEALRLLKKLDLHKAIEAGLVAVSSNESVFDVSISQGWELYMQRCRQPEILGGVSANSQKRYEAVYKKHLAYCQSKGISNWSEINKKSALEYGAWLAKQDKADRTILLELNVICAVSKWLIEEEHLAAIHRFVLKMSKPDGSDRYCYQRSEVVAMLADCNAIDSLNWMAAVITGLATTGLRIGELAGLRWTDIDFPSNTLRISDERARPRSKQTGQERRIKGKRGRAIPLHPSLVKTLKTMEQHADGFVFHGQRGGRLDARRVLEALQNRVIENLKDRFPSAETGLGFKDGVVHSFRHYFCSEAYRNGATDAELLEWLGHRDSEMMKLYRHLRPEDGKRKMDQINFLGSDDEEVNDSYVA